MCNCKCHQTSLYADDILSDSIRAGDVVELKDHSIVYDVVDRQGDAVWVQRLLLVDDVLFFSRPQQEEDHAR